MSSLAKRRALRRAKSGGAIIFIVAMTLAVLASLGLYALTAASNEVKTSGYERQAAQTQYLAEYAILAASQRIDPGVAAGYLADLSNASRSQYNVALPHNGCYGLAGVAANTPQASRFCQKLQSSDFVNPEWAVAPLAPSTVATPGSLGATNFTGDFAIEVTAPMAGPLTQGFGIGPGSNTCDVMVTVTGVGRTMPTTGTAVVRYGASSLALTRAQVVIHAVSPCQ